MKRIAYIFMLMAVGSALMVGVAVAGPAAQSPVHDATVTNIQGPAAPVLQGEIVTIDVTVANLGAVEETIAITLYDDADNVGVDALFLILGPGEALSIGLQWNTEGASGGGHTLTATATVADDADPRNNSRSTDTPIVVEPTGFVFGDPDNPGTGLPHATFEGEFLLPGVDTPPIPPSSFFTGNAKAAFERTFVQPNVDTPGIPPSSFFTGNADAAFGEVFLEASIVTPPVLAQNFFVGNADAAFHFSGPLRRPSFMAALDANCDEVINIFDVIILLQYIVGLIEDISCQLE